MKLLSQNNLTQLCLSACFVFGCVSCVSNLRIPTSKFNNANEVTEIRANVILTDNTIMSGYLTLNVHSNNQPAKIRFPKQRSTLQIPINNIKAYEIEDAHYALKLVQPVTQKMYLWGKPMAQKKFVQRITPTQFAIQLYSCDEKVADTKSSLSNSITHYFVEFTADSNNVLLDVLHHNFEQTFNQRILQFCNINKAFAQQLHTQKKGLQKNIASKSAHERMKMVLAIAKLLATLQPKNA